VRWTEDEYAQLLRIGGGKERLISVLTPEVLESEGLPKDEASQRNMVQDWHREKTRRYKNFVHEGLLPARPGIRRVAEQAQTAGWMLAVASTSAEESVRAVLEHVMGERLSGSFEVFAGDVVPNKKPSPDIYLHALERLGISKGDSVVIEDSRPGMLAALAAGLVTIVTASSFTMEEDFTGAALVVSSLGEEGDPAIVMSNPYQIDVPDLVDLSVISAVARRAKK